MSSDFTIDFPISFVKKEQRIVVGIATADCIDKTGDLVDFEASKEAFNDWAGNIREMHNPIAVGRAISYTPVKVKGNDGQEYNAIKVEAYISKGAQDTWEKVLDGTLRAFSIGGSIIEKKIDASRMFRGRPVNVIKKYRLGELSLVDNPANPVAIIDIIKMDNTGHLDYILKGEVDLTIPAGVRKLAQLGLDQHKEHGRGGTSVGLSSARRLARGGTATPEFVRKVNRYFPRHEVDLQAEGSKPGDKGYPSNGRIAWNLWGGDAGRRWAAAKVAELDNHMKKDDGGGGVSAPSGPSSGDATVTTANSISRNPTQGYPKTRRKKVKKKEKQTMKKEINGQTPLVDALNEVLSNAVVLYFTAHRAHWNVEGQDFFEYHSLFETIYEDIYDSLDPLAENVRKLGSFPVNLSDMEDTAEFEDDSSSSDAHALALDLYNKNDAFIQMIKTLFDVATSANEQGIANFVAERIDMHEKWAWQLKSSLLASGVEIPAQQEDEAGADQEDIQDDIYMADQSADDGDGPDAEDAIDMIIDAINQALGDCMDRMGMNKAAPTKLENGESFPAEAYAYVPDASKPSTWKLRLWESVDSKETAAQVGRAIAAIGKGFRGNKVDIPTEDTAKVKAKIKAAWSKVNPDKKPADMPDVLKFEEASEITKKQDETLQNDVEYDKVFSMNEQDVSRLSLIKRMVNWLIPDVKENASTANVEVSETTQEEEVDLEILKDALSAVVDEKLAVFATSIKEEVEASMQEKIDTITKGFDAQSTELQEKLGAAEKALAEQEEQVKAFGKSGAIKKSVDPEDDEEEELVKSAPTSVWNNIYLPQGLISSLGYKS